MEQESISITVKVPADVRDYLVERAKREGRTLNNWLNRHFYNMRRRSLKEKEDQDGGT